MEDQVPKQACEQMLLDFQLKVNFWPLEDVVEALIAIHHIVMHHAEEISTLRTQVIPAGIGCIREHQECDVVDITQVVVVQANIRIGFCRSQDLVSKFQTGNCALANLPG